jgi:hypothetical protein
MISVYQFAINNTKTFIGSDENMTSLSPLNVFQVSKVLSIAFMKDQDQIIADLIVAGVPITGSAPAKKVANV